MAEINPKQIETLPWSVLEHTPAGVPPPGIVANTAHPPSIRTRTIVICTVFVTMALLFFATRVYVKLTVIRKAAIDDYTCTIGLLFILVEYSAVVVSCTAGAGGKHIWDSTLAQYLNQPNLISNWMTPVFVTPALGFVKLTFFFQYYALFWPFRWVRWSIWIGGIIAGAFYLAVTIAIFALASPRSGESWIETFLSGHYLSSNKLSVPTGVIGASVDLFLLVLPVRAVLSLSLPKSKKIGLLVMFTTGTLAVVASIVGLYYRIETDKDFTDAEWHVTNVFLWYIIELSAGVICSCMPSTAKLLGVLGLHGSKVDYSRPHSSKVQSSFGVVPREWHALTTFGENDAHSITVSRDIRVFEEPRIKGRDEVDIARHIANIHGT